MFSEEFGWSATSCCWWSTCWIGRGLVIAANGATSSPDCCGVDHADLLTYAFVNIGMVSGILPVVGVPLPLMSYGGTAMVTLGLGAGLLAISRQRKLVQT